jgi:hypothetical protein
VKQVALASSSETSPPSTPPITPSPAQIWGDLQALLQELDWFVTRDWQQIVSDSHVGKALIRRATGAALLAEDIRTDIAQAISRETNDPNATAEVRRYLLPHPSALAEPNDPPHLTEIPVTVDRVTLYEFGVPKEHEHPLYTNHHIVNFCAAFYHEEEFVFARAHLQLLLTPANILNWLAGPRSNPVDQNHMPLPYVPDGNLFHILGMGITQLIYLNQTELMMRMKQGKRFEPDYKLTGIVMPGILGGQGPVPAIKANERQHPPWLNTKVS